MGVEQRTDERLALVERDMAEVLSTVRGIAQALQFPEQSPLGRSLVDRSERNDKAIERAREHNIAQDARLDALESRSDEQMGVLKAIRIVSVLLGIAVALFTLAKLTGYL